MISFCPSFRSVPNQRVPLPMFGLLTHGVYPFHKICVHILSSLWHFYRVDSISLRDFRNKHQPSTYDQLPGLMISSSMSTTDIAACVSMDFPLHKQDLYSDYLKYSSILYHIILPFHYVFVQTPLFPNLTISLIRHNSLGLVKLHVVLLLAVHGLFSFDHFLFFFVLFLSSCLHSLIYIFD